MEAIKNAKIVPRFQLLVSKKNNTKLSIHELYFFMFKILSLFIHLEMGGGVQNV